MQASSRTRFPAWLLLAAIIGASAVIWALAPRSKQSSEEGVSETEAAERLTGGARSSEVDLSRVRQAMEVLSRAHDDLANAERRGALNELLSQGDAPTKLTMLLEAAAADPSAPENDPLWPDLVQGLSAIWQGDGLGSGMDLMFTESRARARDALVSSFAKVATERPEQLTPEQRQKLIEYFIDLHKRLPPMQQREVETAQRKIAGNDVADLLQGKGMASDEELELQREYKRSLEENHRVAAQ